MSIFWIGALMMALKLESTIWLVDMTLVSSLFCTSFEIEAARPRCETLRDAVAGLRWIKTSFVGWSGAPAGRRAYRSSQVDGRSGGRSDRSDFNHVDGHIDIAARGLGIGAKMVGILDELLR